MQHFVLSQRCRPPTIASPALNFRTLCRGNAEVTDRSRSSIKEAGRGFESSASIPNHLPKPRSIACHEKG